MQAAERSCRRNGRAALHVMNQRFHFADAFWFRVPLKTVVVGLTVFAILSLYPALLHGTMEDRQRAIFGLMVVGAFVVMASVFTVAINDGHVTLDEDELHIRFEAFFNARVPLADVAAVREIDPRPRWRYRFGLSTDFGDRIGCSHGGKFVEIELSRPCATYLWPRRVAVRRFWIAVREHETLLATLRREIANRPDLPGERAA